VQHTALRRRRHETQVRGVQRRLALRGERRWPCNPLTLPFAARCRPTRTFPPSKTAAQISGGALPMAQRFFALSGITPLTRVVPVGSGGR
jgi:hypothetical protein